MQTRFSCCLNGVDLSSYGEAILVTDIIEDAPVLRVVTGSRVGDGQSVLRHIRESLTVRIRLVIRENDPAQRRALYDQVKGWVEPGGILTLSTMADRRLNVRCTSFPAIGALNWLEPLDIAFTAFETPYWEDTVPYTVPVTTTKSVYLPGTTRSAPLDVTVTNRGSVPLTTLTISCATSVTFSGLSIAPGGSLAISHPNGFFAAVSGQTSLLPFRASESDDDLLFTPGVENTLTVSGNTAVSALFAARGRYA